MIRVGSSVPPYAPRAPTSRSLALAAQSGTAGGDPTGTSQPTAAEFPRHFPLTLSLFDPYKLAWDHRAPLQRKNVMKKSMKPTISSTKIPAMRPPLKTIERRKKFSDALARWNAANNAVNASFRTAEAYLNGLNLGIGAVVKVLEDNFAPENYDWPEGDWDTFEETYLAYEPVGDRFRITVYTEHSIIIDGETCPSSTAAPHVAWDHLRDSQKRCVVANLPDLLDALAGDVELLAEAAEEQSAAADAVLSRVA